MRVEMRVGEGVGLSSELKPRSSPAGFPVLLVHLRGPARGARRINGAPQMRWCYLKRGRSRDGQISGMSRPPQALSLSYPDGPGGLGAPAVERVELRGWAPELMAPPNALVLS